MAHFAPRTRVHSFDAIQREAETRTMTDVTVKIFDELVDYAGQFLYAGKDGVGGERRASPRELGRVPPPRPCRERPGGGLRRDRGDVTLHADGETWHLERGTLGGRRASRCSPSAGRPASPISRESPHLT